MLNQDLKIYDLFSCKLSISQVIVPSAKETRTDSREILAALDRFAQKKRIDLAVLVFTSILENGSVIYAGGSRAPWPQKPFQMPMARIIPSRKTCFPESSRSCRH